MSEEITSHDNTEDVQDQSLIGGAPEEQESKGPAPIYEETEEDKALKASEQEAGEEQSESKSEDQDSEEDSKEQEGEKEDKEEEKWLLGVGRKYGS